MRQEAIRNFFIRARGGERIRYEPIRSPDGGLALPSPINYSVGIIEQCRAALERLYNCRDNLRFLLQSAERSAAGQLKEDEQAVRTRLEGYRAAFTKALDDDLNTADALSALFELARGPEQHPYARG